MVLRNSSSSRHRQLLQRASMQMWTWSVHSCSEIRLNVFSTQSSFSEEKFILLAIWSWRAAEHFSLNSSEWQNILSPFLSVRMKLQILNPEGFLCTLIPLGQHSMERVCKSTSSSSDWIWTFLKRGSDEGLNSRDQQFSTDALLVLTARRAPNSSRKSSRTLPSSCWLRVGSVISSLLFYFLYY